MRAKNTNSREMEEALKIINEKYDNNIKWKRYESGKTINFTLTVKDTKKAGARKGFSGKRVAAACWHVHGDFFDALFSINPEAVIVSMGKTITIYEGNWEDRNIGNMMCPLMYSEACYC